MAAVSVDRRQGACMPSPPHGLTLRGVSWLARTVVFAATGAAVFMRTGDAAVPIVAYALCVLLLSAWALLDARGQLPSRRATTVPMLFGAMAVVSGVASVQPHAEPMLVLAAIALLEVGGETSPRAGTAVAALAVLAVETTALLSGASTMITFGAPLILLLGMLTGSNRRAYRVRAEQAHALLVNTDQLRAEQRRVAVLDERARIAREIHDVLAHSLGALSIQIQAARVVLATNGDAERTTAILDRAQHLAADGLAETRRAVHALRGGSLLLDREVARLAADHQRTHAGAVTVEVTGQPAPLPADQTVTLIRIMQESLTNAAKHAPGQPVQVRLHYADDEIVLRVSNPMNSTPTTVDGGYGLLGMRERLTLQGGSLATETDSGRWILTARVPR